MQKYVKLEINKYMENLNGTELIKQYETILDLEEENEILLNEENINNKDNDK